jgi:hypothetical protein
VAALQSMRTLLLLGLATAFALAFVLAGPASAQFEDDGFEDDGPQVSETPEGGVAAGSGTPLSGSALPLLLIAGALGTAALGGVAARRLAARA